MNPKLILILFLAAIAFAFADLSPRLLAQTPDFQDAGHNEGQGSFAHRPNPGATWTQAIQFAPWDERTGLAVVAFKGQLWVLGGRNGVILNSVWCSVDGTNWSEASSAAPWISRVYFPALVFKERM